MINCEIQIEEKFKKKDLDDYEIRMALQKKILKEKKKKKSILIKLKIFDLICDFIVKGNTKVFLSCLQLGESLLNGPNKKAQKAFLEYLKLDEKSKLMKTFNKTLKESISIIER